MEHNPGTEAARPTRSSWSTRRGRPPGSSPVWSTSGRSDPAVREELVRVALASPPEHRAGTSSRHSMAAGAMVRKQQAAVAFKPAHHVGDELTPIRYGGGWSRAGPATSSRGRALRAGKLVSRIGRLPTSSAKIDGLIDHHFGSTFAVISVDYLDRLPHRAANRTPAAESLAPCPGGRSAAFVVVHARFAEPYAASACPRPRTLAHNSQQTPTRLPASRLG